MSRRVLKRDAGTGQLCGEPVSSVCVLASGAPSCTASTGGPLGSHTEEQLTISIVIWESASLPTELGEERRTSGEVSLVRSCMSTGSEAVSMLTLLHNPHRLCRVSSRFCSSSLRSCSSRSFSFFCREDDSKARSLSEVYIIKCTFVFLDSDSQQKITLYN